MLKRVITFCTFVTVAAADVRTREYTFTASAARERVLQYCHHDCVQLFQKPPRPCCGVFEQAMRGDAAALRRVFTERGLQSGDNESWSFTAWPLLHVVGDRHFAAFLCTLNPHGTISLRSSTRFFTLAPTTPKPSKAATSHIIFQKSPPFTTNCNQAKHLTNRCSQRLAGLFPPFLMIKMPPEKASRALARRG